MQRHQTLIPDLLVLVLHETHDARFGAQVVNRLLARVMVLDKLGDVVGGHGEDERWGLRREEEGNQFPVFGSKEQLRKEEREEGE